jgi:hypothetical protein
MAQNQIQHESSSTTQSFSNQAIGDGNNNQNAMVQLLLQQIMNNNNSANNAPTTTFLPNSNGILEPTVQLPQQQVPQQQVPMQQQALQPQQQDNLFAPLMGFVGGGANASAEGKPLESQQQSLSTDTHQQSSSTQPDFALLQQQQQFDQLNVPEHQQQSYTIKEERNTDE